MKKWSTMVRFGLAVVSLFVAGVAASENFYPINLGELQTALLTAEVNGEDDTIVLDIDTAPFWTPSAPISFYSSENHSLVISAFAAAWRNIIDCSNVSGGACLDIVNLGADAAVELRYLTIQNGPAGGVSLKTTGGDIHMHDVRILSNTGVTNALGGGANLIAQSGSITVDRVKFIGNAATGNLARGGGLYVKGERQIVVRNSIFDDNHASGTNGRGGGMYAVFVSAVAGGSMTFVNNLVGANTSTQHGGGGYVAVDAGSPSLTISNNIVRGNTANEGGNDGDDLYVEPGAATTVINNNDLGDNADTNAAFSEDLVVTNSYAAAGNIHADATLEDDYHLAAGSPCRDAGDNAAPELSAGDFELDPRTVNTVVDIGPDEYNVTTHNVSTVPELVAALNASVNNGTADVVNVAAGTYMLSEGLLLYTTESKGLKVVGAGKDLTTIDGSATAGGQAILGFENQGTPSYVVAYELQGIGFHKCELYLAMGSKIAVRDCAFSETTDMGSGGALALTGAEESKLVTGCRFSGNLGGGLSIVGGAKIQLSNNVFANNLPHPSVSDDGGGVGVFVDSTCQVCNIVNNTIVGNQSPSVGGGLKLQTDASYLTAINVYNNIVRGNTSSVGGNDGDDIYMNTTTVGGNPAVVDLIANDLGDDSDVASAMSEDLVITDTGNYGYSANRTDDPGLDSSFHIAVGSPCVDNGNNFAPGLPTVDMDGDARVIGSAVDIGADEVDPDAPIFTDDFESGTTAAWSASVP